MAVDLHTADLDELMSVRGIGRARATAIVNLRESEEGITMLGLVTATNVGQEEWARLHEAGIVTMQLPAEHLAVPGGGGSSGRESEEEEEDQRITQMRREFEQRQAKFQADMVSSMGKMQLEMDSNRQQLNIAVQQLSSTSHELDQAKKDVDAAKDCYLNLKRETEGQWSQMGMPSTQMGGRNGAQSQQEYGAWNQMGYNGPQSSSLRGPQSYNHSKGLPPQETKPKDIESQDYRTHYEAWQVQQERIKEEQRTSAFKEARQDVVHSETQGDQKPDTTLWYPRPTTQAPFQTQAHHLPSPPAPHRQFPSSQVAKGNQQPRPDQAVYQPSWNRKLSGSTKGAIPTKPDAVHAPLPPKLEIKYRKAKSRSVRESSSDSSASGESSEQFSAEADSGSGSEQDFHQSRPGLRMGGKRERRRSPMTPKMQTFHGEAGKWRSFYFQFKETAIIHHWRESVRLEKLMTCMRDKAIDFIQRRSSRTRHSYEALVKALKKRYGQREPSTACRRQLSYVKQDEEEDLDDFAERVHQLVQDGYPKVDATNTESLAVDAFLRGCKDKLAAILTMGSKPHSVRKAVRKMKNCIQDQKSIGRSALTLRQVSFQESPSRSPAPAPRNPMNATADLAQLIAEAILKASGTLADSNRVKERAPSPMPRSGTNRGCFTCGDPSHYSRECPKRSPAGSPIKDIRCFNCSETGHYSRECPRRSPMGGSPVGGRKCYSCNGTGHLARECPTRAQTLPGSTTPPGKPSSSN